jgi:hypothetical protein
MEYVSHMSKQASESLTLLDLKEGSELVKKAEMLIDFRGYRIEEVFQTSSTSISKRRILTPMTPS